MKTPSDNIFKLIHSMTAAEKRYFKRHYSSDKSLLTELFDFINSQNSYQEAQIKLHFNHSKLSKNLKVYKVQLFDLLLKSLTSHYNKKNVKSKIRIGLEEVELLLQKEFYDLGKVKLKKLKDLSIKYEVFSYIITILEIELNLSNYCAATNITNQQDSTLKELSFYNKQLNRLNELQSLCGKLNHYQNNEKDIQKYELYLKRIKEEKKASLTSLKEKYFLNQAQAKLELILDQNHAKSCALHKENLELFDEHLHFKKVYSYYYFATLYNYLKSCCKIQDFESIQKNIPELENLLSNTPSLFRNYLFLYFLRVYANYLQNQHALNIGQLESEIQAHIIKYKQESHPITTQIFIFYAHTFMILKKPARVQFYIRRLFVIVKNLSAEYNVYIEILELISHYESDDYQLMEKQIASIKRKAKKGNPLSPFNDYMLKFLSKLARLEILKDRQELVSDFKKEMNHYHDDPVLKLLREYTLTNWLSSVNNKRIFAKKIGS